MLALVDCNACYASCEQIFRPDLRGQPIVVLSNNDGCVVTRNKEAKALDIPDLEPYFKIKHLLDAHGVHVFSSNYELYGDTSRRIMDLLSSFTSEMEIYSIDEAFLDVSGMADVLAHGQAIKRACWREQRMPVCVGIAKTKTLAKLANHIAKKSQRLDGVCVLENLNDWQAVFSKLPVNKVWGIGSRLSERLRLMGIHSVEDLRSADAKALQPFGVTVARTHAELHGEVCMTLDTQPQPKQQIICSRSFSQKITNVHDIIESVANYAVRAAEKLRRQGSCTRRVYVFVQTSRYAELRYSNSASQSLLAPSNDSRDIVAAATKLARQLFRPGFRYAKAGVGLLDLSDVGHRQEDLFSAGQSEQSLSLMTSLDAINHKYGRGQIFIAAQGVQRTWSMSRQFKSPAYTTRFADIPTIKL